MLLHLVDWETWWCRANFLRLNQIVQATIAKKFNIAPRFKNMKEKVWKNFEAGLSSKIPLWVTILCLCKNRTRPLSVESVFMLVGPMRARGVYNRTSLDQVWFHGNSISTSSPNKVSHLTWQGLWKFDEDCIVLTKWKTVQAKVFIQAWSAIDFLTNPKLYGSIPSKTNNMKYIYQLLTRVYKYHYYLQPTLDYQ